MNLSFDKLISGCSRSYRLSYQSLNRECKKKCADQGKGSPHQALQNFLGYVYGLQLYFRSTNELAQICLGSIPQQTHFSYGGNFYAYHHIYQSAVAEYDVVLSELFISVYHFLVLTTYLQEVFYQVIPSIQQAYWCRFWWDS